MQKVTKQQAKNLIMIFETHKINDFCWLLKKVRFLRKNTNSSRSLNAFHSFTEITACFRGFRLLERQACGAG